VSIDPEAKLFRIRGRTIVKTIKPPNPTWTLALRSDGIYLFFDRGGGINHGEVKLAYGKNFRAERDGDLIVLFWVDGCWREYGRSLWTPPDPLPRHEEGANV
jgi:hypothetical protein